MKSSTSCNSLLLLLFNKVTWTNIADNTAVAPADPLYLSLHTADPGPAGGQTASEAAYTSYARAGVARTSAGFTVSGSNVTLTTNVSFPPATGGGETETHWAVGIKSAGTGNVLYTGPIGTYQGSFSGLSSSNTLTVPAVTGVAVNDKALFQAIPGVTLPTGIVAGTTYFIKTITGDQITLSASSGGAVLPLLSDGGGLMWKSTPIVVSTGVTPILTTGTTVTES